MNKEVIKDKISDNKIKEVLFSNEEKSRKLLKNKDKLESMLSEIEVNLAKIPKIGNILADVPVLVSMVRSYIKGKYKAIPVKSIISIISALIYLISPIDIIPDFIPGVGYVDDAAVIAFVVKCVLSDIEDYRRWRDENIDSL